MRDREELIDEIAEVMQDTCDMDVSWHQYATAAIDHLIKTGSLVPTQSYVALKDIAAERERQVNVEGWTPEHDDQHEYGELAHAAAAYATNAAGYNQQVDVFAQRARGGEARVGWFEPFRLLWPFDMGWWKPTDKRRDLIKAGALIVAEIDRQDRIAAAQEPRARAALWMCDECHTVVATKDTPCPVHGAPPPSGWCPF